MKYRLLLITITSSLLSMPFVGTANQVSADTVRPEPGIAVEAIKPLPAKPEVKAEPQAPVEPVAEPMPVAPASPTPPPAPPVVMTGGGCGDNEYANYIYMHESGCRTTAVNSIGCRGIGQACPGSKLPCGDDYACQNAWFTNYAITRYGSWEAAYQWWLAHSWW